MEQYQKLMFAIVSMVAMTGAVLLTTVSDQSQAAYYGPSGMAGAVGTQQICVRNFNCPDSGQMCKDEYGWHCAPESNGYQYAWNMPGKRYLGQERTCIPMASHPGLVQC
ncbi:MAG: hypothetical protein AABX47_03420 [Nanoarchaeota archaeon]